MANLSTIEQIVRLKVPGANLQVISSPDLWIFINKGVHDVNRRLKVRRKNITFNDQATPPTQDFSLTITVPDFVCMDDSGLYYQNGSLWQQLLPKDRKWLDENVYSWRNFSPGAPLYYIQENDDLAIIPAPAVVFTPAYWIYYIQQPVDMGNPGAFPFTGAMIETPSYQCLDDGIIAYAQYELGALLGNKAQGVMDYQAYLAELEVVEAIFTRRPDMTMSRYFKMQGPVNTSSGR